MFGYGLAGDGEMVGDGVGCHGLDSDEDEDGSSGGVSNGLEDVASHN